MSAKHSFTTADYLEWDVAMNLIRKLYRNGNYRMSLLIGCGCFLGLRISDLLSLTWDNLLKNEQLILNEKKTGKRRILKINKAFQAHIQDCHDALKIKKDSQLCFLNRFGSCISVQSVNKAFKQIKIEYRVRITNFSTHTLRKTWARKIWETENEQGRGEQALTVLSELMSHSSPAITRRYIGLRQQELGKVWDDLTF